MTNRTLTSLIVRLAGLALFVKIFDFFGQYFMSVYMASQITFMDVSREMIESFDKLYYSGTILAFSNLTLSLILIFSADWISKKIIKTESEIKVELTSQTVMRVVVATVGIIYCSKGLYKLPINIERFISVIYEENGALNGNVLAGIIGYFVRSLIGILFIFKSEQLSRFLMKRMNSL